MIKKPKKKNTDPNVEKAAAAMKTKEIVRILLYIPIELGDAIRMHAVKRRKKISTVCVDIFQDYFDNKKD